MIFNITSTESLIPGSTGVKGHTLQNNSSVDVYLRSDRDPGPVTAVNGFRLAPGESVTAYNNLYAATDSGAASLVSVTGLDSPAKASLETDVQAVGSPRYAAATRTGGATQPATATGTIHTVEAYQTLRIQNLSTANPLFVKLGEGASSTSFDIQLQAQAAATPGPHFVVIDFWVGPVSVAGTSPSYVATLLN